MQDESPTRFTAPQARRREKVLRKHDHARMDSYFWLRDDTRSDGEVLAYLAAENDFTTRCLQPLAETREALFSEITSRISPVDQSVPLKIDDYWYYTRYESGGEYPLYARRHRHMSEAETLLLDVNQMAEGAAYCDVAHSSMSRDHSLMAVAHDDTGRRLFRLRFRDVIAGRWLEDEIHGASAALAWASDNRTLFYVLKDPDTLLPNRVYRHVLGTPQAQDVLVYEETDEIFHTQIYRSRSREYLFILSASTDCTEIRYLRADQPEDDFTVFLPREPKHEYSLDHLQQRFFVRSNWKAKNFRLLETRLDRASDRSSWKEVIAHRSDVLLEDFALFDGFLVLEERRQGLRTLRIRSWDGEIDYTVDTDHTPFDASLLENPDSSTQQLRYRYQSLITPTTSYRLDMANGRRTLIKRAPVEGGYAEEEYRCTRIWVQGRDGTRIPVSIARHRDTALDGTAPLYLYAYGSYGYSLDPSFSRARISLLQRGFVFAMAHVRGGQELGRHWYEGGRGLRKWNTYLDFIDVTEALVARQYADPRRIFAIGGSAGGKLMGVVANERPDLYRGIVAHVPFVDVVTTMLDDSIPLTTGEYDEWGNPNHARDYFYMLSYSPYDQVRAQDYPHMLVTAGLHDSQVQYWEPAKWVARLRALRTDQRLLLLHTQMDAGHGGKTGRYQRFEEIALEYAFILSLADLAPAMHGVDYAP